MIGIIYCWRNKIDNKRYIGQTINEEKRKKKHLYSSHKKKGHLSAFHTALREYGEEGFEYKVLYAIESEDEKLLKRELDIKEAYYIRKYKSCLTEFGYNETIDGQYKKSIFNDSSNKNKKLKVTANHKEQNCDDSLSPKQKAILEQIRKLTDVMGVPMLSVSWTDSIR